MAQDIGLLLRGLGAAVSNQVPQFRQQMMADQENQMRQQEFQAQQEQRMRQDEMQNFERLRTLQAAGYQDALALTELLKPESLNVEGALGLLEDRMALMDQMDMKIPNDPTRMIYDNLRRYAGSGDPAAFSTARNTAGALVVQGVARGDIKLPEAAAPKALSEANIIQTADGPIAVLQQSDGTFRRVPLDYTPAPKPEAERRFTKDRYGVDRYIDTGEPVLDLAALAGGNIPGLPAAQQAGGNVLQPGEPPEFASMPPDVLEAERAKRKKAESEITAAQQTLGLNLRTRFESLEPVALYTNRLGQMQTIISAVEPSTGPSEELQASIEDGLAPASALEAASDIALIFAFMKMLDPTSVVREGEFATAQNSGGIDDQLRNVYNKLRDGQFLTPEQRANFVRRAYRIYRGSETQYANAIQQQVATAKQFNVPEELTYFDLRPADQFNIDSVIENIRSQEPPPSRGKTFFQLFNEIRNR